jgi:glyoxylase-like metal-dependent hydrolase (beta-lactamase superfamily II)
MEWYRHIVWGRGPTYEALPVPEELRVDAGPMHGELTFRCVSTPGHCYDHHVVYVPEKKWLFAGDLFVTPRPRLFRLEEVSVVLEHGVEVWCAHSLSWLQDAHDQIQSLERVLALDIDTVFCAHRGILKDGVAGLRQRLEWLTTLRRKVRSRVIDWDPTLPAAPSASKLSQELLGPQPFFAWFTMGDFSQTNMISSMMRMPEYAHAALNRRSIGRALTRDVVGLAPPADAKASLGALRLEYGDPLVELAPSSTDPGKLEPRWTFGSPDDVVPGVSRILPPEFMATPQNVLEATTRDDREGPSDGLPAPPDMLAFDPSDVSSSGSALLGGVPSDRLRSLVASASTRTLLPPNDAVQVGEEQRASLAPVNRRAPLHSGEVVSQAQPTLPGWKRVASIMHRREQQGRPDNARTPAVYDSVAEHAMVMSRSPRRLEWAQAVPSRPPVPPAPAIAARVREQQSQPSKLKPILDAPTEALRMPRVVEAMDKLGMSSTWTRPTPAPRVAPPAAPPARPVAEASSLADSLRLVGMSSDSLSPEAVKERWQQIQHTRRSRLEQHTPPPQPEASTNVGSVVASVFGAPRPPDEETRQAIEAAADAAEDELFRKVRMESVKRIQQHKAWRAARLELRTQQVIEWLEKERQAALAQDEEGPDLLGSAADELVDRKP